MKVLILVQLLQSKLCHLIIKYRSKTQYIWRIEINSKEHRVDLLVSYLSGMRRILIDGNMVFEKQMRFSPLSFSTSIGENMISIVEQNDRFDLRIDNQSFSNLYLEEKTKANFKRDDDLMPKKPIIPEKTISNPPIKNEFDFGIEQKPKSEEEQKKDEGFNWDEPAKFSFGKKQQAQEAQKVGKPLPGIIKKEEKKIINTSKVNTNLIDILPENNERPVAALPADLNFDVNSNNTTQVNPVKPVNQPVSQNNTVSANIDFFADIQPTAPPAKMPEEPKPITTSVPAQKSTFDSNFDNLSDILSGPAVSKNPVPEPKPAEIPKKSVPSFGSSKTSGDAEKPKESLFNADFTF